MNAPENERSQNKRRAFLAAAGVGTAGLAIAPGIRLIEAATADESEAKLASSKVRWGMLIDSTKCKPDCNACVTACNKENGIVEEVADARQRSQWVRKIDLVEKRTGKQHSLPMMCQHCAKPPCVDVCPTGASFKRADGLVLVDRHICIGCRYCMMACPYKARSFVHEPLTTQNPEVPRGLGCVEACTFCVQRIDRGMKPACVESCPEVAIVFGDLNDENSDISKRLKEVATTQVRAELQLDTGVRYQGI